MIETIIYWIAEHGYGVIFALFAIGIVGIPLPNEWLLAYLGFLIYKGNLLPVPTVAAAFFGSICGMTLNYVLGRTAGLYLVTKFGSHVNLTPERLGRMHDWFEQKGRWGLLFGYFLPGVRHLTAFAAGTSKMTFYEFAIFSFSGAFVWSSAFISLGYFLEEHWSRETKKIHHILEMGSVAVLVLLAGYLLFLKMKRTGR
ncbi:MAG TPA: DedA family protein [Nitrospirota bacterium]|nr:DedA family protein [Nitrospirota bacterium]